MSSKLPLSGVTVVEMTHNVMGPTCGLLLADFGADVIRVEPIGGEPGRKVDGFARGFAYYFNRNKRSICVDIKSPHGLEIVHDMLRSADVFVENFGPGALDRNGLGWEQVHSINDRLIYCALKGFLPGPYEKRPAMDEVVQMLGGLAYMTGLPDRPLRAGASVADITGGLMGALGVMAALRQREGDGQGRQVMSSLFETVAFFMGQHLAEEAMSGRPPLPMAMRRKSWAVYELFPTKDSQMLFMAVLSQRHWAGLCKALGLDSAAKDERFSNNDRRLANVAEVRRLLETETLARSCDELCAALEANGVPFAPVRKPSALFDDPQMNVPGRMLPIQFKSGGSPTKMPALPIAIDGDTLKLRLQPPGPGEHTAEVLARLGYSPERIAALRAGGVVSSDD